MDGRLALTGGGVALGVGGGGVSVAVGIAVAVDIVVAVGALVGVSGGGPVGWTTDARVGVAPA